MDHIQKYSTKHSEAIVSENKEVCERFMNEVDAAVVYANASTRFTDGEEFGLELKSVSQHKSCMREDHLHWKSW
jgi:gamma-glutamyl phosphate reductase